MRVVYEIDVRGVRKAHVGHSLPRRHERFCWGKGHAREPAAEAKARACLHAEAGAVFDGEADVGGHGHERKVAGESPRPKRLPCTGFGFRDDLLPALHAARLARRLAGCSKGKAAPERVREDVGV